MIVCHREPSSNLERRAPLAGRRRHPEVVVELVGSVAAPELWVRTHPDLRHTARVTALRAYLYDALKK